MAAVLHQPTASAVALAAVETYLVLRHLCFESRFDTLRTTSDICSPNLHYCPFLCKYIVIVFRNQVQQIFLRRNFISNVHLTVTFAYCLLKCLDGRCCGGHLKAIYNNLSELIYLIGMYVLPIVLETTAAVKGLILHDWQKMF